MTAQPNYLIVLPPSDSTDNNYGTWVCACGCENEEECEGETSCDKEKDE